MSNYLNIEHVNMVNGTGLRTVIWFSGCERHCPGCFSPHTHDFMAGIEFNDLAKEELFRDSKEDWCNGITIVGGEPLHPKNRTIVINLVKEHKKLYPNKTIWIYTSYCWSEILEDQELSQLIKYVDVICDGPFIESLKDNNLKWVGSSNQHVINVKERLAQIQKLSIEIINENK